MQLICNTANGQVQAISLPVAISYLGHPIIRPPLSLTTEQRIRANPNHVRRPRNSFILFRSWMVYYSIVPKGNKQTNVSEYAAQVWSELERDGAVRHAFEKLADEEKAEHSRLHPNYRYIPPRAGDDGGLRNGRTSEPNAPIAVPQQSVPTPPQRHPSGRIRETPEPTSEGHNDFHGSGAYFYQPPHTHDEDEDEYYYDLTQELEDDTYHPASPSFRHAPQARIPQCGSSRGQPPFYGQRESEPGPSSYQSPRYHPPAYYHQMSVNDHTQDVHSRPYENRPYESRTYERPCETRPSGPFYSEHSTCSPINTEVQRIPGPTIDELRNRRMNEIIDEFLRQE